MNLFKALSNCVRYYGQKLIKGDVLTPIAFTTKAHVDGKDYIPDGGELYHWLASGTSVGNASKIDFTNSGVSRNVVEMSISSSAGEGCDETFYDLLDDTEKHLALSDSARTQLMDIQNVELNDVFPIRAHNGTGFAACGNEPRFFSYRGKIYFEDKPKKWPPVDAGSSYHRVARIDQGKVSDVCNFSFSSHVE